ncbi:hypothetical protein D3C81_1830090 [compost metagenome]
MAGGHAGAALHHRIGRRVAGKHLSELRTQRLRRLEIAVRGEVVLEEAIHRAGNMAADGVERLVLAAEAVGGAGIHHQPGRAGEIGQQRFGIDGRHQRRLA